MAVPKSNHYHLISHVVFQKNQPIYGPIHVLEKYLRAKKHPVNTIFLPLTFEGEYQVLEGKNKTKTLKKNFSNYVLKYFFEIYFVFSYIVRKVETSGQVVIAVDPLNCFPAVLLKLLFGYRLIYYTADYTTQRFPSKIMNTIYFVLDQICLRACDENWCVSSRIVDLRIKQGYQNKAKFLPNTPIFDFLPVMQSDKKMHKLIYVGRMDAQMNLPMLLSSITKLHTKDSKFSLTLIGGGELESQILKYIKKQKASSFIKYLGPLPNEEVISQIQKHGAGIALYSGGNDWNNFGDSMKIREYQYFGLPVITTNVPSNCQEIEDFGSGIVIHQKNLSEKRLFFAIMTIKKNYVKFSKQTVKNAKARLKEHMLDKLIQVA